METQKANTNLGDRYGMFPQLGAPLGFLCSTVIFVVLTELLSDSDFLTWGWHIPFIASAVLVVLGLYVRLQLTETPAWPSSAPWSSRSVCAFRSSPWCGIMGARSCWRRLPP
jgi:MFS family permease